MSDVEALAEVLLASWRSQGMLHPPFDSDHDDAVKDAEAILASDWLAAYVAAERDRAVREALADVEASLLALASREDYDPWAKAIIGNDALHAVRAALPPDDREDHA